MGRRSEALGSLFGRRQRNHCPVRREPKDSDVAKTMPLYETFRDSKVFGPAYLHARSTPLWAPSATGQAGRRRRSLKSEPKAPLNQVLARELGGRLALLVYAII